MTTLAQAVTAYEAKLNEVVTAFIEANDLAQTKANEANDSALAANEDAASALASKQAAAHIYAGTYGTDPLTRPDGSARQAGDYAHIGGLGRQWNGALWQASDINTAILAAPGGSSTLGTVRPGTGGVTRTVAQKLADLTTDKDSGVLADGVTNDTAALQIANDEAVTGYAVPPGNRLVKANGTSAGTLGNTAGVVYPAVLLTKSNLALSGLGATVRMTSRTGVAAADIQPAFSTAKNMSVTLTNLTYFGLSWDMQNDADAANSNQRGVLAIGVEGLQYLLTKAKSTGNRRGYFTHVQNARDVMVLGHYHRKVTGGFNYRYVDGIVMSALLFNDFSEAIDFDGTSQRVAGGHMVFKSTSRANQCIDVNSVQDMTLGGIVANNTGNVVTINYKDTTPPNYADYVANAAIAPGTYSVTERVIISNVAGSVVASDNVAALFVGWDWSAGPHVGNYPVTDVTLSKIRLKDTGQLFVREAKALEVEGVHLRDVMSPVGMAAMHFISANSNADQTTWSDLDFQLLNSSVKGCQRGALLVSTPSRAVIRNCEFSGGDTLATGDATVRLSNLEARGAKVWFDGNDIEGNIIIGGNAAGLTAWAASTAYYVNQIRSNGGKFYQCTVAGTSAAATGPTVTAGTEVDGTVTWRFMTFPYVVRWGDQNRLTGTFSTTGDAHKYIMGQTVTASLGDIAATGTVQRLLFVAKRRCYVARAGLRTMNALAADATNYRNFVFKGLAGASIASVSTIAGFAANVAIDGGFAANEVAALLEPGDTISCDISASGTGKALTSLSIQLEVIEY